MKLSTLLPLATADLAAAAAHVTELERAGEEVTVCGPASYVRERLAAYREAGVTVFNVEPAGPGPLAPATVAQLKSLL